MLDILAGIVYPAKDVFAAANMDGVTNRRKSDAENGFYLLQSE